MISIDRVSKSYGDQLVLDTVTVDLPAGGVTCLIGPNGAGKSTLLSIMARLLGADAGTVVVGGLDVTTAETRELARTMAVLRQETHLTVRLTVRDLVSFGRFPHNGGRPTPADRQAVEEAIAWMDLEDLAERRLDQMSGGQRQRAFVAMVLAQDTPYLLLDEPLNNLDMTHATAMMRRLRAAADGRQHHDAHPGAARGAGSGARQPRGDHGHRGARGHLRLRHPRPHRRGPPPGPVLHLRRLTEVRSSRGMLRRSRRATISLPA